VSKVRRSKKPVKINSVALYLEEIQGMRAKLGLEQSTGDPWYRGHPQMKWKLVPSLYRCEVEPEYEREILRDFKIALSSDHSFLTSSEIDWLFIAQHHGLPTRILDWTVNPLVALFFVVEDFENQDDGCVVALDPWTLNRASADWQSVPTSDNELMSEYTLDLKTTKVQRTRKARQPMAFRPRSPFKRSTAQGGVFTIHGSDRTPLENLPFKGIEMQRVVIEGSSKYAIVRQLNELAINKGALFGSPDAIATSIRFRYSKKQLAYLSSASSKSHPVR